MTNGEKIQTILDVDRDCTEVHGDNGTMTFTVTLDFWNAEYKEPNKSEIPTGSATKNDLGVDCISRKQAIRELKESAEHHANDSREEALLRRDRDIIKALPPVTPIRPKGHWITKIKSDLRGDMWPTNPKCSECGGEPYYSNTIYNYKFCPYCGAKMEEVGE